MDIRDKLKSLVLGNPILRSLFSPLRGWQIARNYHQIRERYAAIAQERGLRYDEKSVIADIRSRLKTRGYTPSPRKMGEIHTFTFIPHTDWHTALLPDLRELGPVTEFDYVAHGYSWKEFRRADRKAVARRQEMNDLVLPALRQAHRERPVDWIFVYASGLEISAGVLGQITDELGIPIVNMCLDDKQSWTGPWMGDHRSGQIDIASKFDISWTAATVACEWYLAEGARPIYMPEGFDAALYRPISMKRDIPVSFIGSAYGFRPSVIKHLKRRKIPIETFGAGWANGFLSDHEQVLKTINRSQINLGMGGILFSESLTHLKGRDFDISGTGGGVYLTSYDLDLAKHFNIGKEILCYGSREEMAELIRYYLKHPDEAQEISLNARGRCLKDHRWLNRYKKICEILGIIGS